MKETDINKWTTLMIEKIQLYLCIQIEKQKGL